MPNDPGRAESGRRPLGPRVLAPAVLLLLWTFFLAWMAFFG